MDLSIPEKLNFGGGELVEISYLMQVFNISRRTACKYLRALHIKPMYVGKKVFFSLPTFKRIMYVLSQPGRPGFLFPASAARYDIRFRKSNSEFLTEVTDEILTEASNPRIFAEMAAAEGRDPSILKKFLQASAELKEPVEEK